MEDMRNLEEYGHTADNRGTQLDSRLLLLPHFGWAGSHADYPICGNRVMPNVIMSTMNVHEP
jgi:hypothetical protein